MTIKITFRGLVKRKLKAGIRFANQAEEQWFKQWMASMRDNKAIGHPQMIVEDLKGHVPHVKPPAPMKLGKGEGVPKKLSPEQVKQLKGGKIQIAEVKPVKDLVPNLNAAGVHGINLKESKVEKKVKK